VHLLHAGGLAGYEPGALACWLAAAETVGPGTVLDVGANVGIYSLLARALTPRAIVAFEPTPRVARTARAIARRNRLPYRIEPIALSSREGRTTLYLSDVTDASNSLAPGFRTSSRQIQVPVQTLDRYLERTGTVAALLKVDTETTEPDVLAGAQRTLQDVRPWVLCEALHGRTEDRLAEVMRPFGYAWYQVRDEVPYVRSERLVSDERYEQPMWLFAPEPPSDVFWERVRAWRSALAACPQPTAGAPAGPP
jgi:FkbM family methyltransferase